MSDTLKILLCFAAGVAMGAASLVPDALPLDRLTSWALYLLLFLVGIGMGGSPETWEMLKKTNLRILLVPAAIVVGSTLGAAAVCLIWPAIGFREAAAVGAGFGYYSLSSILITKISGETLGVIALLSNVTREILTLVLTPLLVRRFGKLAGISAGGATAMDTTLPVIVKFTGPEYAVIAIFSGVVLTLLCPFLVTAILG